MTKITQQIAPFNSMQVLKTSSTNCESVHERKYVLSTHFYHFQKSQFFLFPLPPVTQTDKEKRKTFMEVQPVMRWAVVFWSVARWIWGSIDLNRSCMEGSMERLQRPLSPVSSFMPCGGSQTPCGQGTFIPFIQTAQSFTIMFTADAFLLKRILKKGACGVSGIHCKWYQRIQIK